MASGLELYEALKVTVGEAAARMIAEALPMNDQVATKTDIAGLRADFEGLRVDFEGLRAATKTDIEHSEQRLVAYVDTRLSSLEARIYQRMLSFNLTLFLGLAGMIVAIVLKG